MRHNRFGSGFAKTGFQPRAQLLKPTVWWIIAQRSKHRAAGCSRQGVSAKRPRLKYFSGGQNLIHDFGPPSVSPNWQSAGVAVGAALAVHANSQAAKSPAQPGKLDIDRLYSLPWLIGSQPKDPAWSPDSRHLAFLWNDTGMDFYDVWITDVRSGKPLRVTNMPRSQRSESPGKDVEKLRAVERAEKDAGSASAAELTRCRQVIREWALRDARTTVDEEGKPLR